MGEQIDTDDDLDAPLKEDAQIFEMELVDLIDETSANGLDERWTDSERATWLYLGAELTLLRKRVRRMMKERRWDTFD